MYFRVQIGIFLLLQIPLFTAAQNAFANNIPGTKQISEERFITINGIEQWITIKGASSKPVILFLHGGPGSPLSPYADAIYSAWQKDFIVVQWDQRGTGKTFGRTAPVELSPEYLSANPLTVDQMTTDGIELAAYLVKYLSKQKVILFGTSWGSVLGAKMAIKRPDLFYAYIGHSQVVHPTNNLVHAYEKVLKFANQTGDSTSMNVLQSLGAPPYDLAKKAGQLFRVIKKYERKNSIPAPDSLWKISPLYNNEKDSQHRSDGDDYSFVNYVGDKRLGIKPMMATVNLLNDGTVFKIPVYLVQGEEDILTPAEITKDYFNKISAPKKEFFLLPKTAHGFNLSVIEAQYQIMKGLALLK